ncbi:MAG TPA: DUF2723 domain-containing protein [Methylomirabilota bacterium]|nr:DUF2723 domain-containing protein [Methylomirabilota bacterium]
MEKPKPNQAKPQSGKPATTAKTTPPPAAPPLKVAPLFRKIDWLVLIVCFAAIWIAYLWTLAPDLTLEDSGELCTASFYAGIPHPPGYPFWSVYSYLWTLLPFGSVTWRVEVGESFAAAMACGLVGLMVSRGSSMLIEGIQELKEMNRKWENAICIVCGIVAGLLLGFDDFMWKESVVINRISVFDVPWLMLVAVCLMRWIYAPHQWRYVYAAMFFFGLCLTIHQTMILAAMGIEVALAMTSLRLGRDLFLGNSIIYGLGLMGMASGKLPALANLDPVFLAIFHVVGLGSIAACFWLAAKTKALGTELKVIILLGLFWFLGAAFYFYEPLSGMTDPPMQWGYPRTVEGFFHALSRGQYEQSHPTDILHEKTRFIMQLGLLVNGLAESYSWVFLFVALLPFLFLRKIQKRERSWIIGLAAIYFCVGILLTIVMNTTPDRQTAGEAKVFFTASHAIVAIMIGYGLALMSAYMATHYARFRPMALVLGIVTIIPAMTLLYDSVSMIFYGGTGLLDYIRILVLFLLLASAFVFAALSVHLRQKENVKNDSLPFKTFSTGAIILLICSMFVAFARTTVGDIMDAWQNLSFVERFVSPFKILISGTPEIVHSIAQIFSSLPRIFTSHQYSLPVIGALILVVAVVAFVASVFAYRNRAPMVITLALFTLTPVYSALTHWAKGEERNHWFGYWFGHDMFTPPFVGPDGKFSYDSKLREQAMKGQNGNMVYPEMTRDAIVFGGTDPGRFCPTYMIFCESFVPPRCKPMDPAFDRRDCYLITQNALADGTYLDYLRAQYFRSAQIDPPFFKEFLERYWQAIFGPIILCLIWIAMDFIQGNPRRNRNAIIIGSVWIVIFGIILAQREGFVKGIPKAAFNILDKPLTKFGANVETRRRAEGVYPPKEIYIPSELDLNNAFRDYSTDAERRKELGRLQPGENVQIDEMGRVQASGQVTVMMINGLLCKVIFDKNPTNDFYIEESFPLEWMYPYETPFGVIMKINREPLQSLSEEVLKRDHEFWSKYCERLIGTNVVTSETTVAQITNFVQKVYLDHNYSGFKGDLKFIRDDDAQKAFSKLRDSQAGMYAWRLKLLIPPEQSRMADEYQIYRPKSDAEVQQLYKEADFAFKQSFAFCPYSPETVMRYINFLFQFNHFDDALMVIQTAQKLDPYNDQYAGTIKQIEDIQAQVAERNQALASVQKMETKAREHPANVQNLLSLGGAYYQMQQTDRAIETFDKALASPAISSAEAAGLAQFYSKLGANYFNKLETVLEKLAVLAPDQPESYYELAAIKALQGKTNEALDQLRTTMDLNAKRLKADPTARDLAATNRTDVHFDSIRNLPEYQKIIPPQ